MSNKLSLKGLRKREEFLRIAVKSKDKSFLNCLKDKKNLSNFNALCEILKEVKVVK